MKTYIGIDLGGTFDKYGLVGEVGEIFEKGKIPTPAGCGYAETIEAIASAVRGFAKSGASVCGLGIGAPGVVDGEKGIVRLSGNLGWVNKPLAQDLSAKLGIPAVLTNDANAFRPEAILIGGGISAQGESLTKPLQRRVDKLMLGHGRYAPVKIKAASLGNDAGLVGAAMLAKEKV